MAAVPIAMTALASYLVYHNVVKPKWSPPKQTEYLTCGAQPATAHNIWIDKPVNTILRNDRDPAGQTPTQIQTYLRNIAATEASLHPGVQLVAHAVA